jgi:RimJ/RimL family protein N-acetyltransferase
MRLRDRSLSWSIHRIDVFWKIAMGKPESAASEFRPVRVTLRDGRSVTLREIRPHDADAMRAAFERLSAEARYSRFMMAVNSTPAMVERAVRPLADRERALVAVADEDTDGTIVGGARYVNGRDGETCEFAVTITDGWRGVGLASSMMRALIRDARTRGLKRMEGYVLAANRPMLDLARRLDFEVGASDEGRSVKLVRLDLAGARGGGN